MRDRESKRPGRLPAWAVSGVGEETLARHARCRFGCSTSSWCFDGFAAFRLRRAQQSYRLLPPRRHGQVFSLARERQAGVFFTKVYANQIADMNLFGGQKIRQRIKDVAFVGP